MQTKRSKLKSPSVTSTQAFNSNHPRKRVESDFDSMTYYTKFDSSIQCEENAQVTPEEYDEVMQMMADEHTAQEGFGWWSASVEDGKDWLGNYSNVDNGATYNGIAV